MLDRRYENPGRPQTLAIEKKLQNIHTYIVSVQGSEYHFVFCKDMTDIFDAEILNSESIVFNDELHFYISC